MSRRDKREGFTLIETLVAFAIVALLLLPLLNSFSRGMAGTSRADAADAAAVVAQSTLESLAGEAESARLTDIERQEGAYHVAAHVRLYSADGAPTGQSPPLLPYAITVAVSWHDGARTRSIDLETIRLGPPPAEQSQ